ncbi:nucleolar complex protein 14, partial [Elasticomyces elasticus]
MPPSQLKRLKASLREQGVTGPQKSKKQKKQGGGPSTEQRAKRNAVLQGIRESFNPFEIKASTRQTKFPATTSRPASMKHKGVLGRPGVTKSMGEEAADMGVKRRRTLLPEMQRRNKTGGILDRRIGENDPTLTPEERALQRYAREKQRTKGAKLFDLEDAGDGEALTHLGQAIDFGGGNGKDDFDGVLSEHGSDSDDELLTRKRRRASSADNGEGEQDVPADDEEPAYKKTKKEVMEEVIAKSKLYKYERQKAKEDDDDLRAELDKGLQDMLASLHGHKPAYTPPPATNGTAKDDFSMNPDRAALLNGMDRQKADKEYDARLKQLAMDARAAPTERTKTAEEQAAEEAQRLKDLEASRLRRMQGVESESEDEAPEDVPDVVRGDEEHDDGVDDAAQFGLSMPQPGSNKSAKDALLVLDDEDEFLLEDDLIASGSDLDQDALSDDTGSEMSEALNGVNADDDQDEEDEFVRGILARDLNDRPGVAASASSGAGSASLAFTYACPRTHEELLSVFKGMPFEVVPTVVQRIRALYHPSLSAENKEKLADFSVSLVDHIAYLASIKDSLHTIEALIRHIHSLSRTYPETIAKAFRNHLRNFHERGFPNQGDLVILTAIGSIYPTSDHFHQVVTPAITLIARWLGITKPRTLQDSATGAFLVALCAKYQTLAKRY